jgi:hypothetical protein
MDLRLTRSGHVRRRDVADGTVQSDIVVMLDLALHQTFEKYPVDVMAGAVAPTKGPRRTARCEIHRRGGYGTRSDGGEIYTEGAVWDPGEEEEKNIYQLQMYGGRG